MANAAWTYDTIITALQKWPVNTNADYVANLSRILSLGELRVVRDLNLEIFDVTLEFTHLATAGRLVPKPADLLVERSLRLGGVSGGSAAYSAALKRRSYDYIVELFPDVALLADKGPPEYMTELTDAAWYVAPTPDADYVMTVRYLARPAGMTSAAQTSWLGTFVPDALFAACLMESEHFIKADDRYDDWKKKYETELLPNARIELRNLIRSGDYTPYKPAAQAVQG